jgi:hypothetical protein
MKNPVLLGSEGSELEGGLDQAAKGIANASVLDIEERRGNADVVGDLELVEQLVGDGLFAAVKPDSASA